MPSISQYILSIAEQDSVFRTLGPFEPDRNIYGEIEFCCGNNAVIVPISHGGTKRSLKCFVRRNPNSREIYEYIASSNDPLFPKIKYMENEIYVFDTIDGGGYHDIAVSEWIKGNSLEKEIRRAACSPSPEEYFRKLASSFDHLAVQLLEREWAHGDLKPENIIVDGNGKMHLIDFDAMFIPAFAGRTTNEIGTAPYQHPARDEHFYNKHIDDYSIAVISVSLHALALKSSLFLSYNRSDNILFYPEDMIGESLIYETLLNIFAESNDTLNFVLTRSLRGDTPVVDEIMDILRKRNLTYPLPRTRLRIVSDKHGVYGDNTELTVTRKGNYWGYTDSKGKFVIEPVYDFATDFKDDLAVVCFNGIWQVINIMGEIVVKGNGFQIIKPFSENIAAVKENGKWGYIDQTGTVVIEPQFDMGGMMREDRAVVKVGNYYGYIDRSGKIVIPARYSHASGFRNGRATVEKDGEIFCIDIFGCKI